MSEWKEYSGSDEQIDEIAKSRTDVLLKYRNGVERLRSSLFVGDWQHPLLTHYLICNPHPLADMICQQARTGQPVWISIAVDTGIDELEKIEYRYLEPTTTPEWNIPNAEYSFTPLDK